MSLPDYKLQFDFPNASGERERLSFDHPTELIVAHHVDEVQPCFEAVERAVSEGKYVAGYVAYEAAPAFDSAMSAAETSAETNAETKAEINARFPLLWFGVFGPPSTAPLSPEDETHEDETYTLSAWEPNVTKPTYASDIARIKAAIAGGETYQVNYTLRLNASFAGDAFALYEQMKRSQRASYSAFLDTGRYKILSASPELFFRLDEGTLQTKPMKGTIRRGRCVEEDMALKSELYTSEKNRAEHVMIVDLLRNDLGRVSEMGSVEVEDLFAVETYPTFFTMTSTIKSKLEPDTSFAELFAALFPCGSVTGAPKIQTMKLIAQLEGCPRRVYCGAIGYITPERNAVFNVPIRTVLIDAEAERAEYGVGGGVVWDSEAADEYDEAMLKTSFLSTSRPDFDLLETLKFDGRHYVVLERHIARLLASAAYFGRDVSELAVRQSLQSVAERYEGRPRRVRLLVGEAGQVCVSSTPLGDVPSQMRACLASSPVNTGDVFLYHKTTNRDQYEAHLKAAASLGVDDVLLWNEQGELTEFTKGNVVVELGGVKWTPSRDCGLLQGTLAEELLAKEQIYLKRLHKSCLDTSSKVWFINSVRGWVEVTLVTPSLT